MQKKELTELRQQANKLKPTVIIGANGLTNAVHDEIDVALDAHELIKIRVNAIDKEQREAFINTITEKNRAKVVKKIGHTAVLYRKNRKK